MDTVEAELAELEKRLKQEERGPQSKPDSQSNIELVLSAVRACPPDSRTL